MRRILLKLLFIALLFSLPKIGGTNAFYSDTQTSAGNQLSTGCWVAPGVPVLLSPGSGTFLNNNAVNFDWVDAALNCSLATRNQYLLELYQGAVKIGDSGWINSSNYSWPTVLADGVYSWKVKVKDDYGNESSFSGSWTFTVDTIAPSVPTLSVSIANSWTKTVSEKISNGNFVSGLTDWTTAGDVIVSGGMAKIGSDSSDPNYEGNYVWENRLMQSFEAGTKTLGLQYDFHTYDGSVFDDPGFLIRLNGQEIFSLAASDVSGGSTGWQQFLYDLSDYSPADGKLNLAIYSGNTLGKVNQSWAYVTGFTTNLSDASNHATYALNSSDLGIDHYIYNSGSGPEILNPGGTFNFPDETTKSLTFQAVDKAGNLSSPAPATTVMTNSTSPAVVDDLIITSTLSNAAYLAWTAPGDGGLGRAVEYDVRYKQTDDPEHCSDFDFETATKIKNVPAPKPAGSIEKLEVLGLDSNILGGISYCFAINTADAAPNWSGPSVPVGGTTIPREEVNPGDIIINEVMWGGNSTDWFVELRNMTNRVISLTNSRLILNGVDLTCNLTTETINPHGYFVVTQSNCPGLVFSSGVFVMELHDSVNLIDQAGDGDKNFGGDSNHSMERTAVPGDGTNPLSWYTCLEGNTKGAENRSENEPISHSPSVSLSKTSKDLSFVVENIDGFTNPTYELTYDTDTVPQGAVGKGSKATITLGTCSTGGTCVYHTGVKNIHLKVTLTDKNSKEFFLEIDLP